MSTSDWREYKTPKLILSAHLWMHWRSAGFLKRTRTSMLWNSKSWAFLALLPKNSWLFFFSFAFSNKHVRAVCQVGLCWEEKQADKMVKRCCWATSKSNTLHPDCVGGVCVFFYTPKLLSHVESGLDCVVDLAITKDTFVFSTTNSQTNRVVCSHILGSSVNWLANVVKVKDVVCSHE